MSILIIDNNDSFTYNLRHLLQTAQSSEPDVISYDSIDKVDFQRYDTIVISPGPGKPSEYPNYSKLFKSGKPIIGVCLGMQIMAEFYGGEVSLLEDCFHGRTESIEFDGKSFEVARYHSLAITRVPSCFTVISSNQATVPMAMTHNEFPYIGYQFHPESFLTKNGQFFIDYAFKFINSIRA
ncbi:MAG: aminodeoxychorismate/anthranilate synthase component II [candidate division Zixibacteria bacterium]|nr:aminodeoxychorismate/anthranilate synthase component II [candidate division Zixibacteria bacterium]